MQVGGRGIDKLEYGKKNGVDRRIQNGQGTNGGDVDRGRRDLIL